MSFARKMRTGSTLLELVVVLALIGLILSVTSLGTANARPSKGSADSREVLESAVSRAREQALADGKTVTGLAVLRRGTVGYAAYSDGVVITDSMLPVAPQVRK
jgi:type II secretory pathway pseudopilin PulG